MNCVHYIKRNINIQIINNNIFNFLLDIKNQFDDTQDQTLFKQFFKMKSQSFFKEQKKKKLTIFSYVS